MLDTNPRGFLFRGVIVVLGLAATGLGLFPLLTRGETSYTNWWGGLVFAPFAVLFGIALVAMALLKPEWLGSKSQPRR